MFLLFLLLFIRETYLSKNRVNIRVELLLTLSLCGGWWVVVVVLCKVIFMSNPTYGYVRLS